MNVQPTASAIKAATTTSAASRLLWSWLVKDGRTDRNPLAHLATINAKVDVRRERRFLPPVEFALFVQAARKGKAKRKVTGEDRAILYVLAANSGFRCSELNSLTPESFDLVGDSPTVTVEAAYSKRRARTPSRCLAMRPQR